MKKLLFTIGLVVTALVTQAQSYYGTNNLTAAGHQVLAVPIDTVRVTAWTTNLTPTLLSFYNGWLINTNAAWTNYTAARSAVVTAVTNSTGSVSNYTNFVWVTTANPNSAANVANTPVAVLTVPASGTANQNGNIVTYNIPISFTRFLTVSNSHTGASFLLEYRNR